MSKKITKVQTLSAIRSILKNEEPEVSITIEGCVDFLDKEIALLSKKNSTPSKAVQARQESNSKDREILMNAMREGLSGVTCSQIADAIEVFEDYSSAKIAALLKPLVAEGKVRRDVVKGKALFFLA